MVQTIARSVTCLVHKTLKQSMVKTLAGVLLVCPRRNRFKLALWLVPFVLPIRWLHWRYRMLKGPVHLIDSYREDTLGMILGMMRRFNIQYDPMMTFRGIECVPTQGAILVNVHFCLNFLISRWCLEQERPFSAVMGFPDELPHIPGTDIPLNAFAADIMVFEKIKRQIASGDLVIVFIDSDKPFKGSRMIETAVGPHYISANMMEFAATAGIPLVYVDVRLENRGKAVTTFTRLASANANGLLDEFGELMKQKINDSKKNGLH